MNIQASASAGAYAAGQPCEVRIQITASQDLPPGSAIEFQFPNSWLMLNSPSYTRPIQTHRPSAAHYIQVSAQGASFDHDIRPRHLNHPAGSARHGRLVTATLAQGRVVAGQPVTITYASTIAPQVAETEALWLRVNGEAPAQPVLLVTTPGPAVRLRLLAPSSAKPGQTFDLLIVSLDEHGNVSNSAFENQLVRRDDGVILAQNLRFTGAVRVPASIPKEGIYRYRMDGRLSNAIRVSKQPKGPFWGDLHVHSRLSHDACGADPLGYARNASGLDFAAVADHVESLGPEGVRQIIEWAGQARQDGRFVPILADERNPHAWTGHHNLYAASQSDYEANAPVPGKPSPFNPQEPGGPPPDPARLMIIPHHTGICFGSRSDGATGSAIDWGAAQDYGLRPVMEIYSHHGQSELYAPQHILAYEFNRMRNPERRCNVSVPGPYYAQDHWKAGRRIGVIASSDAHNGQAGRPHGGIAAVFAPGLSERGVFDALRARRCYATTGERILLDFDADGLAMGQAGARPMDQPLRIALCAWGTDTLITLEILRFRFGVDRDFQTIATLVPRPETNEASLEVEDILEGPVMYYARVTQEPLAWPDMAWTSPVWIDVK